MQTIHRGFKYNTWLCIEQFFAYKESTLLSKDYGTFITIGYILWQKKT